MANSYGSLYEMFNPLTIVTKSRFVEWFDGNAVPVIWNVNFANTSGSVAIDDTVDGGLIVTTGAYGNAIEQIDCNNKRNFSNTACTMISITKATTSNAGVAGTVSGFQGTALTYVTNSVYSGIEVDSFFNIASADGSTRTRSDSSVANDTSFHTHKIVVGSSNILYTIDGANLVTKTTNLPTVKLQPFFGVSGNVQTGRIRYLEAFNQ